MLLNELKNTIDTLIGANPFCASMVDEDGREIPITEEMIMKACDELMQLWQFPSTKKAA